MLQAQRSRVNETLVEAARQGTRGLLLQEVLAPPAHSEDAVALLLRMSR